MSTRAWAVCCVLGLVLQAAFPPGAGAANSTAGGRRLLAEASPAVPVPVPVEFLDLKACYELALLRMESVGLSEQDVKVAQARYWQAVGAALPSVKIVGEQAVYSDRGASFGVNSAGGGMGAPSFDNTPQTARVNVKVPLFSGLRDIYTAQAFQAEVRGGRLTTARLRQTLYLETAEAFYQVLLYEQDAAILAEIASTLARRVEDQERRVRLGKSRDGELIQARSTLAQARVSVERTNGLLAASRELLAFYTGLDPAQLRLRDTTAPPPNSTTLADYLSRSGERPDVLAAVQAERSARARLSAAKGEHLPKLTFEGGYYLFDSDRIQDGEWSGFLTVEVPLFEGGSIEARVNENKALFSQRTLDVSRIQRETVRDIRTAWSNFNASVAELARTDEATKTAELNYRAQEADYQLGVVNSLEVLDALRTWHDNRRDLAAAQVAVRLNLVKLHIAAGEPPAAKSQNPISQSQR